MLLKAVVYNTDNTPGISIEQIIEAVKNEDLKFLETALNKFETKELAKNERKAISNRSA